MNYWQQWILPVMWIIPPAIVTALAVYYLNQEKPAIPGTSYVSPKVDDDQELLKRIEKGNDFKVQWYRNRASKVIKSIRAEERQVKHARTKELIARSSFYNNN